MTSHSIICLIDLKSKKRFFTKNNFLVLEYDSIEMLLKVFLSSQNKEHFEGMLLLINGDTQDVAEIANLINRQSFFYVNSSIMILENSPTPSKLLMYRKIGIWNCVDIEQTNNIVLLHVNRRLEGLSQKRKLIKYKPYKIKLQKRLFDLVVCVPLMLLLIPVFLGIMLMIRLESKGPVIYSQKRVGACYKIFNFYKFRSMYVNADKLINKLNNEGHYQNKKEMPKIKINKNSSQNAILIEDDNKVDEQEIIGKKVQSQATSFFKFDKDPRVTKVGYWLRKTSLDELPQLFNVVLGDISIVGNRPLPLYEAETLTNDLYSKRFLAPAGITGLWQVTERGKKNTTSESRRALDNEYAAKNNLLYDLKILAKTPKAMIQEEDV